MNLLQDLYPGTEAPGEMVRVDERCSRQEARRLFLIAMLALSLSACGGGGASSTSAGSGGTTGTAPTAGASSSAVSTAPSTASFDGSILLGAPTDQSVELSVLSKQQSGTLYASYGRQSGQIEGQTPGSSFSAGTPVVLTLGNLSANTQYYYRLNFTSASGIATTPEYTFHTARPAGSSFVFTLQADSHLDENSDLNQYLLTLGNVRVDKPDFHIDLGDTFMTEKHSAPLTATVAPAPDPGTVIQRYRYERDTYGTMTHSVPLFLANGNHDGELGWLRNGTANSIPVWATQARKQFFLNPMPNSFYSGDTLQDALVEQRAAWYSWTWGDALFVVLDPYWNSATQASQSGWNLTLGTTQYQWLADTLSRSAAKYKFVFLHNLVGGLDGQMRGGIEAAPFFEWGGKNLDGSDGFTSQRPGWSMPIHALLVKNKATAVFHGHDHVYVKQELDGIVYQSVPQPSAVNTSSGPNLAKSYHYSSGTILSSSGHLRITVTPTAVTSEYVRAWLPAAQNAKQQNGQVDDRWTVQAR